MKLSAFEQARWAVGRALRLVLSPDAEWRAAASEPPDPWSLLRSFVFPLACIPAAAWSLSLWLLGSENGQGGSREIPGPAQILYGGLTVWVYSVLSVLVLASSIYLLAPLFVGTRDWVRALRVSALSASPVFLGGVILVVPDLGYALLLVVFHSCYLLYVGLQRVLGVKEGNAAEYVALSIVMLTIVSTIFGFAGSALGLL